MSNKKYEILSREPLFQGYFRVDRYRLRHERMDGSMSDAMTREIFECGRRAAGVLLFDPQRDNVALIDQFRAPLIAHNDYPWITEIVAGIVGSDETPENAARREALEEAGCEVTDLQPIFSFYPSHGAVTQFMSLFVGRTADPKDGLMAGVPEEGEDTRVNVIEATKAISMLYAGKFCDAATIIAMQWFALHHTELRSRWLVSEASTPII